MQIRSAAKWIAAAAGILVGAVIVGFTLKDTTYIEAKLEQIKGARQSVTAVEKTTAKTQKIKNAEIVKETPLPESSSISDFAFTGQLPNVHLPPLLNDFPIRNPEIIVLSSRSS